MNAACDDCHSSPCCALYSCSSSPLACGSEIKLASCIIELLLILYDGCCWSDCIILMDFSHSGDWNKGFPWFCFCFWIFHLHFNGLSLHQAFQIAKAAVHWRISCPLFYKQQEAFKLGQCWNFRLLKELQHMRV